jgi:hypothetical protein
MLSLGCEGYLRDCISSPNLRLKWVREDIFECLGPFVVPR